MTTHSLQAIVALSAVVFLAIGCEKSSDNESGTWQQSTSTTQQAAPATQTTATTQSSSQSAGDSQSSGNQSSGSQSSDSQSSVGSAKVSTRSATVAPSTSTGSASESGDATETDVAPDQVAYGSLSWRYGGIGGGGYKPTGVSISGLHAGKNGMSFKYNKDLSAWGYGHGDCYGYACLFVQTESGAWVGGKFDWISSSRAERDFNNIYGGYRGWSLDGVPNPCQVAFVILDVNAKRRSNVIVGTWKR